MMVFNIEEWCERVSIKTAKDAVEALEEFVTETSRHKNFEGYISMDYVHNSTTACETLFWTAAVYHLICKVYPNIHEHNILAIDSKGMYVRYPLSVGNPVCDYAYGLHAVHYLEKVHGYNALEIVKKFVLEPCQAFVHDTDTTVWSHLLASEWGPQIAKYMMKEGPPRWIDPKDTAVIYKLREIGSGDARFLSKVDEAVAHGKAIIKSGLRALAWKIFEAGNDKPVNPNKLGSVLEDIISSEFKTLSV